MRFIRQHLNCSFMIGMLAFASFGVLCGSAAANDGGIAMGGSPGLLKSHRSVTMTSEVIKMTVMDTKVLVDCRFVFTNHGPACAVRMGFPDQGEGASDPDEEEDSEEVMRKPPRTTFPSFRSYVDGQPVKTRLIRADSEGKYWHTKMVSFPANGVHQIRDVYTQLVGGGEAMIGKKPGFAAQVAYILHTGASWHGNIGRTEIDVTFHCKQIRGALKAIPVTRVSHDKYGRDLNVSSIAPNTVVWSGPCAPTVQGMMLRFVRQNWRPQQSDDLQLTYGYQLEPDSTSADEQTMVRTAFEIRYAHYSKAFARRDFARIGKLLTEDYRWTPPDGEVLNAQDYLHSLSEHPAGAAVVFKIKQIQLTADTAIVTVRQTFSERIPKDNSPAELFQNFYHYMLRDTWVKTDKGWLLKQTELIG